MTCKLTWTSRDGAMRSPDMMFNAYEDAVREVGSAVRMFDQGDVIVLTDAGRVMLRIRCEKAPTSARAASHLPSYGSDE